MRRKVQLTVGDEFLRHSMLFDGSDDLLENAPNVSRACLRHDIDPNRRRVLGDGFRTIAPHDIAIQVHLQQAVDIGFLRRQPANELDNIYESARLDELRNFGELYLTLCLSVEQRFLARRGGFLTRHETPPVPVAATGTPAVLGVRQAPAQPRPAVRRASLAIAPRPNDDKGAL